MAMFNDNNTVGFSRAQLEILNTVYDGTWGAMKARHQESWGDGFDATDLKRHIADTVLNTWTPSISVDDLIEAVGKSLGIPTFRNSAGETEWTQERA